MKKSVLIVLAIVFMLGCAKDTASKVEGNYTGSYNLVGYSSGQATVSLIQISNDKLRLNFDGAGAGPYMISGIEVQEQTYHHYGLGYTDQIYSFTGAIDDADNFTFNYTGDTTYLIFSGIKQ